MPRIDRMTAKATIDLSDRKELDGRLSAARGVITFREEEESDEHLQSRHMERRIDAFIRGTAQPSQE